MTPPLLDRFQGCLLGLAVGDALGGRFEAQTATHLRGRFGNPSQLLASVQDELWYTDDTQMAIGVAETLVEHRAIREDELCKAFVANYVPSRGYGRGARAVLEAMEEGSDYRAVAARHFPGGSFGNGAAMRVAPVGLFFHDSLPPLLEHARASAVPTHLHPLGIEGAQLLALAVAWVTGVGQLDRAKFFEHLLSQCSSPEYRAKLEMASRVRAAEDLGPLGNGIAALESVPTAIAAFALTPHSYLDTVANAILLGGDTDTIAAMAGALAGAHLGISGIPPSLLGHLEVSPKGRDYLLALAERLYTAMRDGRCLSA